MWGREQQLSRCAADGTARGQGSSCPAQHWHVRLILSPVTPSGEALPRRAAPPNWVRPWTEVLPALSLRRPAHLAGVPALLPVSAAHQPRQVRLHPGRAQHPAPEERGGPALLSPSARRLRPDASGSPAPAAFMPGLQQPAWRARSAGHAQPAACSLFGSALPGMLRCGLSSARRAPCAAVPPGLGHSVRRWRVGRRAPQLCSFLLLSPPHRSSHLLPFAHCNQFITPR